MKYKNVLIVLGLLLIISLSIGTSYAFWMYTAVQEGENALSSDCFEITFSDSNPISLEYTFPLKDSEGYSLTPYTFTINNICNHAADFQINLETLESSTLDPTNIRAYLIGSGIKTYGDDGYVEPTLKNALSAIALKEDTIDAYSSKTFNLRIWLKEDAIQSEVENKTFSSKVTIKSILRKSYSEGTLISGAEFNKKIKVLSGNTDTSTTASTTNSSITSIQRSEVQPGSDDNYIDVSASGSKYPIYVWFNSDDGAIYLYTENDKIYLNSDSSQLFNNLTNVTTLDLSYFDTSKVTNMQQMFSYMKSLTSLDLSNFDTSNVTNMNNMFSTMTNLTSLDLSNFDTSNVTNMSWMFSYLSALTTLNIQNFNTKNVTNMSSMFQGCTNLTALNISSFDTSNVTNMNQMFLNMQSLTSLNVSNFNTSNVTSMAGMFKGMTNLISLDVSNFDTSNVTSMYNMFSTMTNLTSLDVSNFDTSNVTSMSWMFTSMSNITSLDLSSFDTSNVTTMGGMFQNASKLTTIYVGSGWDTSNLTNNDSSNVWQCGSKEMFYGDTKLVGGSGTTYDSSYVDGEYARVDDLENDKPGYLTLKTS